MGYAVMRIEKVKTMNVMRQSFDHQYRFSNPANAEAALESMNEIAIKSKSFDDAWLERIDETHPPRKIRPAKNRVLAYDILLSYSPSASGTFDVEEWKDENEKWLKDTFGEKNVLSLVFHYDEASAMETGTIHGHAFVVPIGENGQLNSGYYLKDGGMTDLQDSYGEAMEKFGLERGVKGSRAYHEERKHFYARLQEARNREMPMQKENETDAEYAETLKDAFRKEREEHVKENKALDEKIKAAKVKQVRFPKEEAEMEKLEEAARTRKKEEAGIEREFGTRTGMLKKADRMQKINAAAVSSKNEELAGRVIDEVTRLTEWAELDRKKKERAKHKEEKEAAD